MLSQKEQGEDSNWPQWFLFNTICLGWNVDSKLLVDCDELFFFDAVDLYERLFCVVGGLAFEVEDGELFLVVDAVFSYVLW